MGYWVKLRGDGVPESYSGSEFPGAEWMAVSAAELDACQLVGGKWVPRPAEEEPEPTPEEIEAQQLAALANARAVALAQVSDKIAAARLRIFTDLPGQDAIYTEKRLEAARFLATPGSTLEGFPFLAAEVGVTAPTATELAQLWMSRGAMFEAVGAATEGARMRASKAIAAAADAEAIASAQRDFEEGLSAIFEA